MTQAARPAGAATPTPVASDALRTVGPGVWQSDARRWLEPLASPAQEEAWALIQLLQDQHVSVPPALATALQVLLRDPRRAVDRTRPPSPFDAPAFAIIERLTQGLAQGPDGDDQLTLPAAAGSARHLPATALFRFRGYGVFGILLPVLKQAQTGLGGPMLIAPQGHPEGNRDRSAWQAFVEGLHGRLSQLTAPPRDRAGQAFWRQAAMVLHGLCLTVRATPGALSPVPEPDSQMFALLDHCQPDLEQAGLRRSRPKPRALLDAPERRGERPQQGGVADIRLSRRVEDLDSALISELILPGTLRQDRLLNSGFLVKHRPPPRDTERDVLLLGLSPLGAEALPGRLAKLAWLDYLARAAALLRARDLRASAALWLERAPADGYRMLCTRLGQAGSAAAPDPWSLTVAHRWHFLEGAGWMPGVVDSRYTLMPADAAPPLIGVVEEDSLELDPFLVDRGGDPLPAADPDPAAQAWELATGWLRQALPVAWAKAQPVRTQGQRYGRAHGLMVMPHGVPATLGGAQVGVDELQRLLDHHGDPVQRVLSVLWPLVDGLTPGAPPSWHLCGQEGRLAQLSVEPGPEADAALTGTLVAKWLSDLAAALGEG